MATYTWKGIEFKLASKDSVNNSTNVSLTMDEICDEVDERFIDMFPEEQPVRILITWRRLKENIYYKQT